MPYFKLNYYDRPTKKRSSVAKRRTIINKIKAWERGKELYDGSRLNGFGGFKYDGRWKNILPPLIKRYNLKSGSRVLDVGCKKGFLLHDLKELVPGIKIFGVEDHVYPIKKSMKTVRRHLRLCDYHKLKFKKNFFDAVFSFHCIYRLNFADMIKAIKEIQRVTKKNSYITFGAYNDKKGKEIFDKWGIISTSHMHVKDLKTVLKYLKYKGDYSFTTPEILGLK